MQILPSRHISILLAYSVWSIFLKTLWLLMFAMIIHFLLVFPLRKWPLTIHPHSSLWLLYGISIMATFLSLSTARIVVYNVVLGIMVLLVIVTLFTSTIQNLRHLHGPVVRAQVGWVAFGISAPVFGALFGFLLEVCIRNSVKASRMVYGFFLPSCCLYLLGLLLRVTGCLTLQ